MSMRTAESNKAIASAWEKERQLVLEGKGTRDWTPEQQQDILDKGKAYGDDGRALEGHHMKSAEAFPEYQGEPGNIQFLSRTEHLAAHGGDWKIPTNGKFNPTTGETIGFGLNEYKPCEIIELTDPIPIVSGKQALNTAEVDKSELSAGEIKEAKIVKLNDSMATNAQREFVKLEEVLPTSQAVKNSGSLRSMPTQQTKVEAFRSSRKDLWRDIKSYAATYGINSMADLWAKASPWLATATVTVGAAYLANASGNDSSTGGGNGNNANAWNSANNSDEDTVQIDEPSFQTEPVDRSSPSEHTVPSHSQRYHTKEGVVTRVKQPYPRGGKKTDD